MNNRASCRPRASARRPQVFFLRSGIHEMAGEFIRNKKPSDKMRHRRWAVEELVHRNSALLLNLSLMSGSSRDSRFNSLNHEPHVFRLNGQGFMGRYMPS